MSNKFAIRVEQLGKRYYTPQRSHSHDGAIKRHLKNLGLWKSSEDDHFWALRDVSFEVKPGEILGILGKNGSGKSTLLKILSGVTPPSTGRAKINGRIGSLLEVGTGFHPDMSGRENIYMNGVLLGISKKEIDKQFDELVDFSGIEEFIDVPVKRYSSGMYVRLAYAVASKLRSDILILDEVLAVGDMTFQKKARENIKEMTASGRTILFVSHHVQALASLCTRGIVLDHGQTIYDGQIPEAIHTYIKRTFNFSDTKKNELVSTKELAEAQRFNYGIKKNIFERISLFDIHGVPTSQFKVGDTIVVRIDYKQNTLQFPFFAIYFYNDYGQCVASINTSHSTKEIAYSEAGILECRIEDIRLAEGEYTIMLDYGYYVGDFSIYNGIDCIPEAITITIFRGDFVPGVGLDAYHGPVHRSLWKNLTLQA